MSFVRKVGKELLGSKENICVFFFQNNFEIQIFITLWKKFLFILEKIRIA